jgi:hypothetical protein
MGMKPCGIGTLAVTCTPLVMARVEVPTTETGGGVGGGLELEQAARKIAATSRRRMSKDRTIKTR